MTSRRRKERSRPVLDDKQRARQPSPEDKERARQAGRGRRAESPQEIPSLGWKDVLWRTKDEIKNDHIQLIAAGFTFYALLALFPMIAALVSIYGLLRDPGNLETELGLLAGVLPAGALEVIRGQLTAVAGAGEEKLGLAFVFSLAITLWSANKGFTAMFEAMNIAYGKREKRGWFKRTLITLAFTAGGVVFLVVALAVILAIPPFLEFLGLESVAKVVLSLLRWPLLFAVAMTALALIYRYGPSRSKAQWRWVSWGSASAALLWVIVSVLFSWYAQNFGSYNETYGSLGAVVVLMTWIWLSATIVLTGAELNSEIEHQTAKDTTTGRPKPLGGRGAHVADTVGPERA